MTNDRRRACLVTGVLATVAALSMFACRSARPPSARSPHHRDKKFHNDIPVAHIGLAKSLFLAWRSMTENRGRRVPHFPIPVERITASDLADAPDASVFRLGHSSVLLKLGGALWLTDPVFSDRASPVQWAGPKRFHRPPIDIADLPPIKGVILSHDHYDHLDHATIMRLAPKVDVFITPMGVGDRLISWGVNPAKVRQLHWWQQTDENGIRFIAAPARHFSGRGLTDRDRTLWASWVIIAGDVRLYFSGDTGYHADFKTIGVRYGPFDLTLLETGAYDAGWPDSHMLPHQTLQAHLDLQGRWLMPVHNGTFNLAMHSWYEPFDRIHALAARHGVKVATPSMGERLSLAEPHTGRRWWNDGRRITHDATQERTAMEISAYSATAP